MSFVFGQSNDGIKMEVDADSFLDNESDDTEPQQESKNTKEQIVFTRYQGQSATIRIAPIPRGESECSIYDFIMTAIDSAPVSIFLAPVKKPFAQDTKHALHDAQQCYIVLQTKDDAVTCANQLNKTQFAGFECQVSVTKPSRDCRANLKNETTWIKLTNLKKSVSEQTLLGHIQKHGSIKNKPKNILLFQHPTKANYAGYAFVACANTSDATQCVENLRNTTLKGQAVWCTWRHPRKDLDRKSDLAGKTRQLILGNVHYTLQQNDIMEMCAKYGQVEHVQMWQDKVGYPIGSASITMKTNEDATKVFEGLQGQKEKNLKVITAYTKIGSFKKKVIQKLKKKTNDLKNKSKNLKKELLKSKKVVKRMDKKLQSNNKKLQSNAKRARGGNKGRRDGVGQRKQSNTRTAFNRKTNKGRGGPKFA
eukprot:462332_1